METVPIQDSLSRDAGSFGMIGDAEGVRTPSLATCSTELGGSLHFRVDWGWNCEKWQRKSLPWLRSRSLGWGDMSCVAWSTPIATRSKTQEAEENENSIYTYTFPCIASPQPSEPNPNRFDGLSLSQLIIAI